MLLPSAVDEVSPIDFGRLEANAHISREQFAAASPWNYVVIDDFLEESFARRVASAFPPIGKTNARLARFLEARSYDARIQDEDRAIVDVFEALHSERFTRFIETVSGVFGLDPDRDLVGAGLHQGARGSYLRVHADHNTHPLDESRYRRVNVMVYLNDTWQPEWNGDLELWDREAVACQARIEPKFNRAAILSVDDTAFHGYGPLRVPENLTRKALAAYYYAGDRAAGQAIEAHTTSLPPLANEHPFEALTHRIRRAVLFQIQRVLPGTSPGTRRD